MGNSFELRSEIKTALDDFLANPCEETRSVLGKILGRERVGAIPLWWVNNCPMFTRDVPGNSWGGVCVFPECPLYTQEGFCQLSPLARQFTYSRSMAHSELHLNVLSALANMQVAIENRFSK